MRVLVTKREWGASNPFHTLLADTIEMCGGSRVLTKILNQLGAVASTDAHDRFITAVAEHQREQSVWDNLPDTVFTIASADNFDILQSHAAVYCRDQSRSYHSTTVQIVQPNPKLVLNTHVHKSDPLGQEHQTQQSSLPTSLIWEGQTVTSMPTSPLREGLTVTRVHISPIREGQSVTSMPTSPLQEGQPIRGHTHTNRWDLPIASQGCSTQARLTTLDRDNCHTIAVDEPTPISLIAAKWKGRYSPASSPHKLGKIGPKKRRTVVAQKVADLMCKYSHSLLEPSTTPSATTNVTLEGFAEDSDEKAVFHWIPFI